VVERLTRKRIVCILDLKTFLNVFAARHLVLKNKEIGKSGKRWETLSKRRRNKNFHFCRETSERQ
jgi:hypothetical protein